MYFYSHLLRLGVKNIPIRLLRKQEGRTVARKPRDAAAVLFGLKFADNIHTSLRVATFESQALELQTYRRKTEFNKIWPF